jgi:UDP-N-acetylglucosamine diphosphorylase/glucosamine-1-phosphate N-acetyltransferase
MVCWGGGKVKAVVLAAGEGVRLQPVTLTRPKHLIKVGGKPILEHCLRALKSCGVDEVVLVVHYMADVVRGYFGDGQSLGLKVEYVEQKEVLGTGNAVGIVEPFVEDDFLLVYGDLLFTVEAVKKVVGLYEKEKPVVTMAVVPVDNPEGYGIVEVDDEGNVKCIVEKPGREDASSNLANAGMYVFSKEIFEKIRETSASVRGEWEVTDAISLLLREGKRVLAVEVLREDWFDVGRPWDLLEANRWVLLRMDHKVYGIVEDGARLVGAVTVLESARVRSGAYVEGPVFIGEKSDVGPNCFVRPCTSIGENVRIGNCCEVKNSLVMDGVHVGHLSYIGDSIVGEDCNLGAGTVTANLRLDDGSVKMLVKGVVVDSGRRKLGVVLGDGVKSGINALFMPGVKVGCNSWIGPNVVVSRDVAANRLVVLKQDLEERKLDH